MYSTSEFRKGLKIEIDGVPYEIVDFQHVKPGKGNQFTRTRLRNLLQHTTLDRTFKSGEKVGRPDMVERTMQFLFSDDTGYTFMDTESYEQIAIPASDMGDSARFLKENMECSVLFYNNRAIAVDLPNTVILKVVQTDPGVRGDTATGGSKPATLETGAVVNVPLFVNEGESLKIDTRTGAYIERA